MLVTSQQGTMPRTCGCVRRGRGCVQQPIEDIPFRKVELSWPFRYGVSAYPTGATRLDAVRMRVRLRL